MLSTTILLALVSQYPDAIDHLRAGNVVPQVGLLLDRSCSMGWGHEQTDCTWFAEAHNGGDKNMNKREQMQATLIGCKSATDGMLDQWSDRVNFSIYEFGTGTKLRTPFGSDRSTLEAGVLAIPATGSTNMSLGLRDIGRYFNQTFSNANTLDCRPNFVLMLSDGNPNGGGATFDWECSLPSESRAVGANEPWRGSDYLNQHDDLLCSVDGNQNLQTYTIGFGKPGDFSPSNLQNIAASGGGEYFYASDAQQLSVAFESIIGSIVSRSAVFFAPIAIQTESMFSDNYAYTASFKPLAGGPWRGNLKKHCIAPPPDRTGAYDTTIDSCLFTSNDGHTLLTNPRAVDLWTGSRSLAADRGGASDVMLSRLGSTSGGTPAAPFYDRRNILTWRPGTADYVPVKPATWGESDTWTNGCEHATMMNINHGYTYDANCATGAPVAVADAPLGDPINAPPILLKYGPCHDTNGQPIVGNCFAAAGMNDGMIHFFDSATGDERSALVPGDLWVPNNVNTSLLREVQLQPTTTITHRFYVDGGSRLFHVDMNLDGYIQSTETAYLVFGLGRGGHAYYSLAVNDFVDGQLDGTKNPIHPLTNEQATSFEDLRQTWAAPWMGRGNFKGTSAFVAIFPSGHVPELDVTGQASQGPPPPPPPATVDLSDAKKISCSDFAKFNGLAPSWCSQNWHNGCKGNANKPCYDAAGVPLDTSTAPLTFNDGVNLSGAIRLYFDRFDLDSADVLRIEDDKGNLVGAYTGQQLRRSWTKWVHAESVVLRLVTDGKDRRNRGYSIQQVQWVPVQQAAPTGPTGPAAPATFELGVDHRPSIFVVDLERFNGTTNQPFTDSVADDGLMLRITNDCNGLRPDVCIDKTIEPDLAHMVCPISAEVSVYAEGSDARAMYWGDECGQIWKAWTPDAGTTWRAKRLINLNAGVVEVSKDHRKIFRKLDLVTTLCPGEPGIGIYFGTGNIQRPTAKDERRDMIGLLWDSAGAPSNLTEADLEDVTVVQRPVPASIVASGKRGWFITLDQNERMLRDPLVFDGVAYFKTYEPTTTAVECGGGSGVDRIYAVDSCSSEATNDLNGNGSRTVDEREVWNGSTEIGGGLFFFTPKDRPVLVSHADITTQQNAALNKRTRERPGLYFWRWE